MHSSQSTHRDGPPRSGELEIRRNRLPQWRMCGATYFVTWRMEQSDDLLAPAEKDIVVAALRYFNNDRYVLYAYAVMDEHVHVVLRTLGSHDLSRMLQGCKSYTARAINRCRGRLGTLWQKDSYTRIIRTEEDLYEKVMYVLNNPLKEFDGAADYKWYGWNWE